MTYVAKYFKSAFWFAKTTEPVCSLTIDDAPSASTGAILDVLKAHKVQATFFIIEENIAGNEHLLDRMVQEGHVLANHMTQDKASILYSNEEFEGHLLTCHQALKAYQSKVRWIRPGSGWFTSEMTKTVEKHNYRICLGNVYPHDAQIKSEQLNELYLRKRTKAGSILIVHDREWTIKKKKKALPHLTENFRFVSLHVLETHHHHHHHQEQQKDRKKTE